MTIDAALNWCIFTGIASLVSFALGYACCMAVFYLSERNSK